MSASTHANRNLPDGWAIIGGFLIDYEGYSRWVRTKSGRLDATKIATVLHNHGHVAHARVWEMSFQADEISCLLPDLADFLEGFLDGAADASITSKRANGLYSRVLSAQQALAMNAPLSAPPQG